MTKRGKKPLIKELVAEDWCFVCKEGGELIICDYRQCLKAYHVDCVGKDESSLTSNERWNCKWHYCFMCERTPSFHCHGCPKAVCRPCIDKAEFVVVRGNYGFCRHCLKLALLIEENKNVDSDGETVDFKDLKTYEGLFMDYYSEMIKGKTSLTLKDLRAAEDRLKTSNFDLDELDEDIDDKESDYEEKDDIEDSKQKRKREFKGQQHVKKAKNVKSKKMQFSGWGSTPLIQFLESTGQDTGKELHQHKVETLIIAYIKENNLFHPEKKRKVVCDEKLQAIFRRKVVERSRIYSLLEPHFANNLETSEEEEEQEEEDEEEEIKFDGNENSLVACKPRRKLKEQKDSLKSKPVCSASRSSFAAITPENIKLVYLRRSLLQELSKEPESFQNKVKGSFVRVKTDPNDYCQRNSHQLLQVIDVKKSSSGKTTAEMVLHVSNTPLEIHVSSLSDADFEEAECVDLGQKVKDGLIQKPTVAELQEKARSLHEDITKNWIARELKLLDIRINQAKEKGWRRDLYDYKEKRELLQTPSEQSRLLKTYPSVIAEELKPMIEENVYTRKGNEDSTQSVCQIDLNCKWGNNGSSGGKKYPGHVSSQDAKQTSVGTSFSQSVNQESTGKGNKTRSATPEVSPGQVPTNSEEIQAINATGAVVEDAESKVWLVATPNGEKKDGKYSLSLLKGWSERTPYALKFKAWKETETEEQAILVGDAIKLAFG